MDMDSFVKKFGATFSQEPWWENIVDLHEYICNNNDFVENGTIEDFQLMLQSFLAVYNEMCHLQALARNKPLTGNKR